MKLYLFCHGMMLFWYRRRTYESVDGYRILIPQSPVGDDGKLQHQVGLGACLGATDNDFLSYPDSPEPTKFYELQFGAATSLKPRGPKDCGANIGLYERYGLCKAEPNYGYDQPNGVAFAIDIPYPACDDQLRPVTYSDVVYQPGYTREDFQIYPKCIPRSNLFTYEISCPDMPIVLQDKLDPSKRTILTEVSGDSDVKLYLYSGPPHVEIMGKSHLPAFNNMLRYGNHSTLDLDMNLGVSSVCHRLEDTPIPKGFTTDDYRHLAELNDKSDFCPYSNKEARADMGGHSHMTGANPAECSQGGGC